MCPNVANGPKIFSFSILLGMIILVDYDFRAEFCRQAITFVVANDSIYIKISLVCWSIPVFWLWFVTSPVVKNAHQNLQRSVHAHGRCLLFHVLLVVPIVDLPSFTCKISSLGDK